MENEQNNYIRKQISNINIKLLRKDKNVAQKLFGSEKHVFWLETNYSLERLSDNLFSLKAYQPWMNFKPPSNNIYRIFFLKKLLAFKNSSYFKYGIFLINVVIAL